MKMYLFAFAYSVLVSRRLLAWNMEMVGEVTLLTLVSVLWAEVSRWPGDVGDEDGGDVTAWRNTDQCDLDINVDVLWLFAPM